ncbi:VOC family protein [uncultured Desulfuromonas sp.]|nr:VOC family protein [uncultured Desulfuromonas sp.]
MECLLDHIALNVEDDDRMLVFYTEVLELLKFRVS